MRPPRHSKLALLVRFAIPVVALSACQATGPLRVRDVFDRITPGMSCAEVEAMLGQPVLRCCTVATPRVGNDEAWYLPPPEIGPLDAPWGQGAIFVVYSVDNRVVSKRLNPQWREPETRARPCTR